jgi:hypothetical protein
MKEDNTMAIIIEMIIFFFGMCVSIQLIAAFYGILDLWYTIHTAYLKVIRRIVWWVGVSVVITILLGEHWRDAFLWGMALYVPFYVINFFLLQTIFKYRCRAKEIK